MSSSPSPLKFYFDNTFFVFQLYIYNLYGSLSLAHSIGKSFLHTVYVSYNVCKSCYTQCTYYSIYM